VSLDGRLIDYASIRPAEVLVEKARQIAVAGGRSRLISALST
jgi:malyl-CoA/(S)-citramalyl-CoA lyase